MIEGVFKGWVKGKQFGFITRDDGSPDVFVHSSSVADPQLIRPGRRVKFDIEINEKTQKEVAVHVDLAPIPEGAAGQERHSGRVSMFSPERGFGFIEMTAGAGDAFVHANALPFGTAYLQEGDIVEFHVSVKPRGMEASDVEITGWTPPPSPLAAFADMGDPAWHDELFDKAEKEPWEYQRTSAAEPRPILKSYLRHTFSRLQETDGIRFSSDGKLAAFNTGLVTPNQEELYAMFRPNPRPKRQPWKLTSFCKGSDWNFIDSFGNNPPPLANYFDDPSVLLYDRRLDLYINIDHVMEQIERFPAHLRSNPYVARQLLISAEATTKKRVYRSFKTAIPQYYREPGREGSVQLLLPICLENPAKADLALVVAKSETGNAYRGSTILTLDMAYNNARLLARPDTEWLQP